MHESRWETWWISTPRTKTCPRGPGPLAALIVVWKGLRDRGNSPSAAFSLHFEPVRARLLFTAWVIVRIDIVELHRRHSVDLHHDFSAGHCVVMHIGIEKSKTAGRVFSHLAFIKAVSHPDFER